MATLRAILRRVGRVHGDRAPTGPCCLGREQVRALAPRGVLAALGEAMGRHHPVHRAVFHGNQVNLVHKAAAVLVGEIAPPPRAALLDPGHHLAPRGPCARALLLLAEAALGRDERRRCFPEEAWGGKRRLGAEPGEGLEAPVTAHLLPRLRQRRRGGARARAAHLPLAGATAREGRRLGRAVPGPGGDQLDAPHMHDVQALGPGVQLAAHRPWREGEAGGASRPPTAGRAGPGLLGSPAAPRRKTAVKARSMRTATFCTTCDGTPASAGRSALRAGSVAC